MAAVQPAYSVDTQLLIY